MVEKIVLKLPLDLVDELDDVVGLLGFRSRETFVEAAVRRLLDRYALLACGLLENYEGWNGS